ncbi:MAG TPA: DUF5103 domain-containing protein [Puia sp.]|nr:DUF5103 domain-containing protein [Puia sp.]
MKSILFILFAATSLSAQAQQPDAVYMPGIRMPQLYVKGNQLAYPVISLNGADRLDLDFDDIDPHVKNYFYTYQLCNADWTPVDISTFDYIRGFAQNPITDYRYSSIALTRYTHYHVSLPERGAVLTRAGNYLVKVFLDSDTSKLAFTRRLLVVDNTVSIAAEYLQPMNAQIMQTYQKIQFTVNTRSLSLTNPFQQLKVVVLQNHRWDNSLYIDKPSFYSGTTFEYNSDDVSVFPGGKQWRWVDLQSFRYQSDRVAHVDYLPRSFTVYVKPDGDRSPQPYYYYTDYNGGYFIQTTESINTYYQTDYATVKFTFVPPDNTPFNGKDLYIIGAMTGYQYNDETKMVFNPQKGVYEGSLFLKMGYYNYAYVTLDTGDPQAKPSFEFTEGNHFETENSYTILVYYRELGGRADQLVGLYDLHTLTN